MKTNLIQFYEKVHRTKELKYSFTIEVNTRKFEGGSMVYDGCSIKNFTLSQNIASNGFLHYEIFYYKNFFITTNNDVTKILTTMANDLECLFKKDVIEYLYSLICEKFYREQVKMQNIVIENEIKLGYKE